MFDEQISKQGVCYPQGFRAAGVKAGIKKSGNLDVAMIVCDTDAHAAGVFTRNSVAAACVHHSLEAVRGESLRAIVAHAGCANACTGEQGMQDAKDTAAAAAEILGCGVNQVAVASTGVIGVRLPMDKMIAGVKAAAAELSVDGSQNAAHAIMTTDTHSKEIAKEYTIGGKKVRIGAIAKGSGMICPNMATMLAFITTDCAVSNVALDKALRSVVDKTFNMISVDGDMSTNDMVLVMTSGKADNQFIQEPVGNEYDEFCAALFEVCQELAKRIAADGEGATKFLTINVSGTKSAHDARAIAMSVAKSPLVKTAFFGEDPNWGRVVCAVGYCDTENKIDPDKFTVAFGGIPVYADGVGVCSDSEALKKVMAEHDITIDIDMKSGDERATVWTCDMSYEYVKINGEYHT